MTDAEITLLIMVLFAILAVRMFASNSVKPAKKYYDLEYTPEPEKKHYDLEYTFELEYKLTIERVSQDVLDELTDSPHISEREARARAIHREVDRRRAAERKSDDE